MSFILYISLLSRAKKRLLILVFDSLMVPIALYAAFCLRFGTGYPIEQVMAAYPLPLIVVLGGPFILLALRLPDMKLRSLDVSGVVRLMLTAVVLGLGTAGLSYIFALSPPRSVPMIFAAVFFGLAIVGRNLVVFILELPKRWGHAGVPVAIYGAGAAGIQLAQALQQSSEVRPVTLIDDNPSLHGLLVCGMKVQPAAHLPTEVDQKGIERILVALPSASKAEQAAILDRLAVLPCEVQVLPSYVDLISGKSSELRTVSPDALLGRNKVDLDTPEIAKAYAGRTVMVTGAGGSIGSELCRQLLDCRPARIVLFEQSEFALYEIDRELTQAAPRLGIDVVARLGSVTNQPRVEVVMAEETVDIVLHAAAYKHVPLVEDNPLEGARNNVLGTQTVARAAQAAGVERFILVSTDKAVRPTNIMGATKRMAELVIQDLQTRSAADTRFAMVRFGNVLGSSGSVLPLFQKQIKAGGPVTVTHPEVTRFFMTIPEAARLVLLAGAYATGGDVFVLDMGQPMKIMDIARRMIELSGRQVAGPDQEDGIAINVTGLRPGEKLYEELLIDNDSLVGTPHEKILRAQEAGLSQIQVAAMIKDLHHSLEKGCPKDLQALVESTVDGYHQYSEESDEEHHKPA